MTARMIVMTIVIFAFVACGPSEDEVAATVGAAVDATIEAQPTATDVPPTPLPEPTVDAAATVVSAVQATIAAMPTNTPVPLPTDTPTPLPTETSAPTATAVVLELEVPADESEADVTLDPVNPVELELEKSVTEIELGDGVTRYEVADGGFALALPTVWQEIDLSAGEVSDLLGMVGEQNEALETLFSSDYVTSLIGAGMKFYALNLDGPSVQSSSPANVNVIVQDLPIDFPIDTLMALNVTQIEQAFDLTSEVTTEITELGGVEAGRIAYTTQLGNVFGTTVEFDTVQYIVNKDGMIYVISIGVPVEVSELYLDETIDSVVTTFEFLE